MFQFPGQGKPAQGILFDSDFGRTIDSVLSLALLHGLENKKDARIASISISNPSLKAAQLCDVIEKFYASATTGLAAQFFVATAIGLSGAGKGADSGAVTGPLAKKDASGKAVYSPRIATLNDTAEPGVLMRNILMAQYTQNAVVVLAGPATNLVALLDLKDTAELIAQKVKFLSVVSSSLAGDVPAARRLLAEWPTAIVAVNSDMATSVPYPAASIEKDYAYNANHPVADAYRAYKPMPYNAETSCMAAVLYAARPKEEYFGLSEPGTLTVGGDGQIKFEVGGAKKHRYLIPDPLQAEKILKAYTELASAKPVARVRRPLPDDNLLDKDKSDKDKKELPDKPVISKP